MVESYPVGRSRLSPHISFALLKELPAANRPAGQTVDSGRHGTGPTIGASARVSACLVLSQGSHSVYWRTLQALPFLYGLRGIHQPGKVFRDVSAADAALYPSLDYLPALSSRSQGPGFVVLGVLYHECRWPCSRLYERTLCLATGSARRIHAGGRRRTGLLVRLYGNNARQYKYTS